MHEEQRERVHKYLESKGIEQALFANPFTVTWLTGFAPSVHLGPEPASGGPPLAWHAGGEWTLIVADSEENLAEQTGCQVVAYRGMTRDEPLRGPELLGEALKKTVSGAAKTGKTGVEGQALPAYQMDRMKETLATGADLVSIDGWFDLMRAVKTGEEIEKIRRSIHLTDAGHAAARKLDLPGMREIDVWTAVEARVEGEAGEHLALGNNCVVGRRAKNGGGFPSGEEIGYSDTLILDLSARLNGYWSASTATYAAGEQSPEIAEAHRTLSEALDLAISMAKPGAIPAEIDREVRAAIARAGYPDYPHHTGHGIGASGHEEPRILPYNENPLQEGMVVALEPGIYIPDQMGLRLEDVVLIRADGAEVLTHHEKQL